MSGGTVTSIEARVPRAESNPVARKRRMTEQPPSQKTPKTPRRAADPLPAAQDVEEPVEDSQQQNPQDPEDQNECRLSRKPPLHPDLPRKRLEGISRRDDSARLRKTIQWLEDGARKLREDLALARSELHEERKAAKIARREVEAAVRDTRNSEASKYQRIIADLKTRLSRSPSRGPTSESTSSKAELLREENHRREIMATRKRLVEADEVIRKLRSNSTDPEGTRKKRKWPEEGSELHRLECESRNLRETTRRLEEKLQIAVEAEKSRTLELRVQYEKHEVEMNALKKAQRSDMIKMMEEIRAKGREIEKLEKFAVRKAKATRDQLMRKLRESERGQIGLAPRIEDKISRENANDLCRGECEAAAEVERLRELAVEQQEVIEYLRQALKERERKLDQLLNKKRKEEFYKQWLELEPVAEVDDEEEHEGDSALSSAPTSLSPQPGGWQTNVVTRETYEALLLEVDELQTKYLEEHEELSHAKSQVRDLEKALLQETRGSQNSRRALSEKLREAEERESSLLAEMSELREQNELLEFRVLELEESESPDAADSGIVSPEPIQLFKEPGNRQRDRAVATVIPYNSYSQPLSPVLVQKSPLSLQESGIFEEDEVELASCGTQTETPSGELLQEVQRLQELRERIQERAAKVPMPVEACDLEDNRLLSYKEKIRELEDRLGSLIETDEKRTQEQLVVKQREEDLLDENYRLTERVYWLENQRQNICEVKKEVLDAATMTETLRMRDCAMLTDLAIPEYVQSACETLEPLSRCQEIFRSALELCDAPQPALNVSLVPRELSGAAKCPECSTLRADYEDKVQQLARAEFCLRRQMLELERKEGAFAKTLQHVDATWSQLELDQATRLSEIKCEFAETTAMNREMEQKILQLKEEIQKHCCNMISDEIDAISSREISSQTDETMDVDDNHAKTMDQFIQTDGILGEASKKDTTWRDLAMQLSPEIHEDDQRSGAVSRVCLRRQEKPVDADVTISQSEGEEKVRKRRRRRNERDGWAMRAWNGRFYSKNCVKSIANVHRLVLYQEICV